jgi:hypothetical protein
MAHLDANATGEIDSGSPLGEREMNTFDWARLVAAELDDRVNVETHQASSSAPSIETRQQSCKTGGD